MFASLRFKSRLIARWHGASRWCRLSYNLSALLLLIPPVLLLYRAQGENIWAWVGIWGAIANGLAAAALGGFVLSLKSYDGMDFAGFNQLKSVPVDERFTISTFHRFIRHPWYFFALVIIWTRDMDAAMLATAFLMSVYFFVGSRLEESKLIHTHGQRYVEYRQLVPGLIPLPWKWIRADQAKRLTGNS